MISLIGRHCKELANEDSSRYPEIEDEGYIHKSRPWVYVFVELDSICAYDVFRALLERRSGVGVLS